MQTKCQQSHQVWNSSIKKNEKSVFLGRSLYAVHAYKRKLRIKNSN